VGPRAGLDRCEKPRPPLGFDPRTVQSVAIQNLLPYFCLLSYDVSEMESRETLANRCMKRALSFHLSDKAMTCAWNSCILSAVVMYIYVCLTNELA